MHSSSSSQSPSNNAHGSDVEQHSHVLPWVSPDQSHPVKDSIVNINWDRIIYSCEDKIWNYIFSTY